MPVFVVAVAVSVPRRAISEQRPIAFDADAAGIGLCLALLLWESLFRLEELKSEVPRRSVFEPGDRAPG